MMRPLSLPSTRRFTSCSVLALATVLVVGATPAGAQSFLGNGTVTSGTGTITNNVPGSTNVTVTTPQTVIDWVPFDNAIANNTSIAFQNSGTTATFAGAGNYAVLNRINPADSTRNIFMNGTIQAVAAGAAGAANGSIYFYSPGGFVIGANAVINVGSLVLSASPITVTGGEFIGGFGTTNTVVFGQAGQAGATIATIAGSQITANSGDAYVAMVAPRVQHSGNINVSGSAALVGAEAATINFSPDGLFDIQVTAGSTDANGVYNDGNITGSAGSPGDIHRAYLVAVPKNAAMTMLITTGSDLGFDVADFADVVGNTVVLSAGHDIVNGSISGVSAGSTGAAIANLDVRDSTFTSAMIGEATGYAHLAGYAALKFYSSVAVHADGEVWLSTQLPGGSVDIDGSLRLSTEQFGSNGEDVTSSKVQIFNLNGGSINVDGATTIDTDAWGGWSGVAGVNGGDATGGQIDVQSGTDGEIALLGGLTVSADGRAGGAFAAGVDGGVGTGGQVLLRTTGNASTLTVNNGVTINSRGYGGTGAGGECFSCDGDGGAGQGGDIRIAGQSGTGSTLTLSGNVSAVADGFGGAAQAAAATAGTGTGGNADYFVGTGNILSLTGNLLLQAEGNGGNHASGNGGIGFGGRAAITEQAGGPGGTLIINGNVELSTDGEGGDSFGASGGDGFGGDGTDGSYIFASTASITINGSADLRSSGTGGSSVNGTGGFGYGGYSRLVSNSLLTITGDADVTAYGIGGAGATGGDAYGGDVSIRALAGGDLNLQGGTNFFSTDATGGAGTNGAGGDAYGWDIRIYADGVGSSLTISGATTATANAIGGASGSGIGGAADGGDIEVYAQNSGSLALDSDLTVSTNAEGGAGATGGGNASGGEIAIYSLATLQVGGALTASADATGGQLYGTDFNGFAAGDALGGDLDVYAQNGLLTLVGAATLSTDAVGGLASNSLDFAGNGEGGTTRLFANVGGTVDLQSTLNATAIGSGGGSDYYYSSSIGGNGLGGDVRVQATAANASITVAGAATLDASGEGSYGQGGNGTGGTVWADAFGASTAKLDFQSDLSMLAEGRGGWSNNGPGGDGQGGQVLLQSTAGSTVTVGGDAVLSSDAFGGYTYDFSNGSGGNAIGGESRIQTYGTSGVGGNITIDGSAIVSADGFGGDAYDGFGAQGGDGTGGSAHIITTLGTIQILGADPGSGGQFDEVWLAPDGAYVSADGYGGDAAGGTGGDGTGGEFAAIEAIDGDITISGFASVSTSGFGGDGETGGNGLGSGFSGGLGAGDFATLTGGAHIFARNGDIVIQGGASVASVGTGGNGGYDNGYGGDYGGDGGDGTGGWARILAQNSDLGPSSITIIGGALASSGYAAVNVDGTGGNGGDGSGNNAGGFGGSGGDGTAGFAGIVATAGNGTVTIDNAIGYARGTGGDGGNGGNGDGLAGGNGGSGGNGVGGVVNIGTASGNTQSATVNDGLGDYGSIIIDSSAWGGEGGSGNFGATSGDGGNGGNATGGAAVLLVRGSTVNADSVTLTANATGGDAGFGYVPEVGTPGITGIGGDATVGGDGGIGVIATGRFLIPAQRGTLNAGDISGTAIATPGIGIPDGNSQNLGSSAVTFLNADGNIGSLDFLVQTGTNASNSGVDSISVINGDVVVDGEFSFVTDGNLSLFANNGDMHAGILTLSAGDFVFDPINDPPSDRGTYFADSATITTGNNFVTSANLDIGGDLSIVAPGLINAQQFTIGEDLNLWAQSGGITATILDVNGRADLNAAGSILITSASVGFFDADAGGSFTSGNITSDTNIQIDTGANMTLGNLIAGLDVEPDGDSAVDLESGGSILMLNVTALGGIDFSADGSVTGGNLTSGLSVFGEAEGAVSLGTISAGLVNPQGIPDEGFSVGITSATSIITGNVAGAYAVGFATLGPITTGTINAGTDFLVMASGNMLFGPITAGGRVYLADSSMYIAAGGGGDDDNDDFDPALVFAATPVASDGSIVINGPISAGSVQAAAGTSFSSGNIVSNGLIAITAGSSIGTGSITNTAATSLNAGTSINVGAINSGTGAVSLIAGSSFISGQTVAAGSIFADSGSDMSLGNLTAGGDIELIAAGDIFVGNALAGESIEFDAGGYVDGGNMTAGDVVQVTAGDYVDLLNISAGIVDQSTDGDADYNVGIEAGTTIETGDIEAFNYIGLAAQDDIYTGSIDAGNGFLALGGGDMSFGTINSGGPTYLANYSMYALGGQFGTGFDPAPILALQPVASGGSIELRGPVSTGRFEAAAGTTLTGTTINSNGLLYATSGGNMTLGNLFAGNDVRLTSGGNISTGSIDSGDDVALVAAGSISTLDIFAYDDVSADAGTTITTDDITGNSIDLFADGNISTGDLLTQEFFQGEAQLFPGASITVQSGGNVATGTIDSKDGVHVSADGTTTTETIDAETFVQLYAGGNITAGTINAGSYIDILSDTGLLDLNDLHAGTEIDLESDGSLQFGDASADDFNFEMGGSVNGGNIDAINHADGHAEGAIVLENITVSGPPNDGDFSIGFTSATSITVENVDGFDRVGFATLGNLTTGNITAGSLFLTLVGGDIVTGSIATDGSGQVYMADASMCGGGCGDDDDDGDVQLETILALAPVPTGGSILINGPVTTGQFQAASEGNFTAHAIDADSLDVYSEATATIDGMWNVTDVTLVSNDINITANGGIDGGASGQITLNSIHQDGALIGDGLTGSGYALSNAEFGRLSGDDITIIAGGHAGAGADTQIGDLAITGPLAGSNVESNGGGVHFITLSEAGTEFDGDLRVVGDVVATGFGADNYLAFYTQNFELDAATGLISITGSGGALAGTLELYASRIHVAEGAILDQLAVNPQYAGYREDLNQQAAVQRPEGVIRAANFDIEFGGSDNVGPYTLFVQNMGTTTVPAGFLLNAANIGDDGEGSLAPGSVDMAINGQIITEGGTLTGIAVRDLLVTEFGTSAFVAGSTINGCPLVGACLAAPPPRIDTPTRTDVPLNDSSGLGDGVDGSLSNPPAPLLDTAFLGQSDDVNDPVSGAGNPSLYGASSDEDAIVVCDGEKDKKCKTDTKGDGK